MSHDIATEEADDGALDRCVLCDLTGKRVDVKEATCNCATRCVRCRSPGKSWRTGYGVTPHVCCGSTRETCRLFCVHRLLPSCLDMTTDPSIVRAFVG